MSYFSGSIFSWKLRMYTSLNVIIPQTGQSDKKVLYLLHGLCDNSSTWSSRTRIEAYALQYDYAVFMPEVQRSFYMDIENGGNYFSYVSEELPQICEQLFGIKPKREQTFIAGSSMGGYGAAKCALRYPDRYAGCAAFSGVLDMKTRVNHPEAGNVYPESSFVFGRDRILPQNDDVFALSEQVVMLPSEKRPKIMLTCGDDDVYLEDTKKFDAHLRQISYDNHTCEIWKGGHDWDFWDDSIKKTLKHFA